VRSGRFFSVEDANALVPRLSMLVGRLQTTALRLHEQMQSVAVALGVEPDELGTAELLRRRPQAGALVEELDAIVREIEESGSELKDIQLGLIDFPARRDGEIVCLCWQFGEPEIAYWHHPAEGFAGRRPLAGSARAPSLQ
jgi:hypothetical protein